MSAKESRKVVSRAVTDDQFRELLFENPEKALAGYELTPGEVEALRGIPSETIDDFANNLEDRISMAVAIQAMGGNEELASGWMTGGHPSIEHSSPEAALADDGGVQLDHLEAEAVPVNPASTGLGDPNLARAQLASPNPAEPSQWLQNFLQAIGIGQKGKDLDGVNYY